MFVEYSEENAPQGALGPAGGQGHGGNPAQGEYPMALGADAPRRLSGDGPPAAPPNGPVGALSR